MPLINATHARAGTFAQNDQAALEFFVFERLEFVKDRKQHNRRQLREQHKESEENSPRDHPPVLRSLAYEHVEQFDHDGGHDQANQQALEFVPQPGAESLVRKVIAVLEPETVVVERSSQHFADQRQHQDVEKNGVSVVLRSASLGKIAEGSAPAGGQQHDEQAESGREIGDAQPPLDAVIAARFRRIGENRCGFRRGHYPECCHYPIAFRGRLEPERAGPTVRIRLDVLKRGRSHPRRLKPDTENKPLTAALKRSTPSRQNRACWGPRRCATQRQEQNRIFQQTVQPFALSATSMDCRIWSETSLTAAGEGDRKSAVGLSFLPMDFRVSKYCVTITNCMTSFADAPSTTFWNCSIEACSPSMMAFL